MCEVDKKTKELIEQLSNYSKKPFSVCVGDALRKIIDGIGEENKEG